MPTGRQSKSGRVKHQPRLGHRPGLPPTRPLRLATKYTDGAGNASEQKINDDRRPIPDCKKPKRAWAPRRHLYVEHAGSEREHGHAPHQQHERARHVTRSHVMVVRVVYFVPPSPQEMGADDHTDHLDGQRIGQHGAGCFEQVNRLVSRERIGRPAYRSRVYFFRPLFLRKDFDAAIYSYSYSYTSNWDFRIRFPRLLLTPPPPPTMHPTARYGEPASRLFGRSHILPTTM
jgi:hypothetical protein